MNADKIAVVDQGRVLEEGSHAELVAQDGIYAALVKKQTTKKDVLIGSGEKESPTLAAGRREMDGSAAASKKGPQTIDHLLDAVSADAAEVSAASSVSASYSAPSRSASAAGPCVVAPCGATAPVAVDKPSRSIASPAVACAVGRDDRACCWLSPS